MGTLYAATLGKAQALRVIIYWVGLSIINMTYRIPSLVSD